MVLLVARELAADEHTTVTVAQRSRCYSRDLGRLRFVPLEPLLSDAVTHRYNRVVLVRTRKLLRRMRRLHPEAGVFIWLHTNPATTWKRLGADLVHADAQAICVSHYHRRRVIDLLCATLSDRRAAQRVHTIFNAVPDELGPDGSHRRRGRLLSLSSPHKGLDEVLTAFAAVRQSLPGLSLAVAHPGYLDWHHALPEGAEWLGPLCPADVIAELRTCELLFYPQQRFAETFGMVIAEANAVGTPVLVADVGAAGEIASSAEQVLGDTSASAITDRLGRWMESGFPTTTVDPAFRLSSVVAEWRELLRLHRQ